MTSSHIAACLAMLTVCSVAGAASPGPGGAPAVPSSPAFRPAIAQPGMLTGVKAQPAESDAGKPVNFVLEGSGRCKVRLAPGDGMEKFKEGNLPFAIDYTYNTSTMTSYQAFKTFAAQVQPQGPCKSSVGTGLEVKIKIHNPGAQQSSPSPGAGDVQYVPSAPK